MKIDVGGGIRLFFDVEGPKIVASESGWTERPTVVVLHPGPGADHSVFKDLLGPRLAEVAQVVYVDQRGDGRSDRSDSSHWNLETWTEDLRALLDLLEIERPVLFGSSVGALVALTFAARYPERPERIVLASAAARYVRARSIAEFDRLGGPEAGEVAARYFGDPTESTFAEYLRACLPLYTRLPLDPHVVARMQMNPEATVHWDANEAPRIDLRPTAAAVQCPVLLLAGEDDPSFTLSGAEELAAALPQELLTFRRYPEREARRGARRTARARRHCSVHRGLTIRPDGASGCPIGRVCPMPIYEYVCMSCESHFEELVGMSEPDPSCPDCGNAKVAKQFSTSFAAHGVTGQPSFGGGGGCCGGGCGSCG